MRTRTWFRVHSFTGVITGLMLFVICWSGTFAVVADELDWLVTPGLRVASGGEQMNWSEIQSAIHEWRPDAEILQLRAPLYSVSVATALVNLPYHKFVQVHVNPGTGIVTEHNSSLDLQRFFREFHRRLLLGDVGFYIVCTFTLTLLTSMVAALCFYKRWWTRFLRFKGGSGRVFWSELHKTAGLWSLWFVLIMVVTGGWYLFEAARGDFGDGKLAYAGDAEYAVRAVPEGSAGSPTDRLPIDALVARAGALRPDLDFRRILFRGGAVVLAGQAGHVLVRDRANRVRLDAHTGEVLYNQRASDLPLYWRWSDTADPLHFGNFAGLVSKLIWLVFGLVLCGLILTGTLLHTRRLATGVGGRRRHRWPGTMAAVLVSLAVLAASAPSGFAQAREFYGPTVDGMRQLPALTPGVQAVIIGWVAVTLAIIAAWVVMLWRAELTRPDGPDRSNAPVRAGQSSSGEA